MNKLFSPSFLTNLNAAASPLLISHKIDSGTLFKEVNGSTVMLDCRVFNEAPLSGRKCALALTKLFHLIYAKSGSGNRILSEVEATDIFFNITKAFSSKDLFLRRLIYLAIKELSGLAKDVIIVTSSLTQDISSSKVDAFYRANAIRTLCKITDSSLIQGIERFIKQSLVDSNPLIASAAILSCIQLYLTGNRDVIRRWVASDLPLSSANGMTRYHGLCLLFLLRANDRISTLKLFQKYHSTELAYGNSMTICLLLRIYHKLVTADALLTSVPTYSDGTKLPEMNWKSLLSYTGNKEMIAYEAARIICQLPNPSNFEIVSAVSVLQSFLGSSKPLLRFAAIRTLNKLALTHPEYVSTCNLDIESIVTDSNRSIATLAITTLLKTGNDASVDRLMTQIKSYMPEISDELKVSIVEAIGSLAIKFPSKYTGMVHFLGWRLRDEGSLTFKKAIVSAINNIVKHIPDSKESAMEILCEFVEDCEYVEVASDVLYLLSRECPGMANPMKYVRHIYNRLLLEIPPVRMAAVGALIQFATGIPSLRSTIKKLLEKTAMQDDEDDIRERARTFIYLMDRSKLVDTYFDKMIYSLNELENQLNLYLDNSNNLAKPFDPSNIPLGPLDAIIPRIKKESKSSKGSLSGSGYISPVSSNKPSSLLSLATGLSTTPSNRYSWLHDNPELSSLLGTPWKSSLLSNLTEPETEYVVQCTKHVFANHLVLQYSCRNTIPDQDLENVTVSVYPPEIGEVNLIRTLPISLLSFDPEDPNGDMNMKDCFVIYQFNPSLDPVSLPLGPFNNTLQFITREKDIATDEMEELGTPDEYMLQDLDLCVADYVKPVPKTFEFEIEWNSQTNDSHEAKEVYNLSAVKTLSMAVKNMKDIFGGTACQGSDSLTSETGVHTLYLAGLFLNDSTPLLIRCRMAALDAGVKIEIVVRSRHASLSEWVANAL